MACGCSEDTHPCSLPLTVPHLCTPTLAFSCPLRLAQERCIHGDLKASNVLLKSDGVYSLQPDKPAAFMAATARAQQQQQQQQPACRPTGAEAQSQQQQAIPAASQGQQAGAGANSVGGSSSGSSSKDCSQTCTDGGCSKPWAANDASCAAALRQAQQAWLTGLSAKVSDFGLSAFMDPSSSHMTRAGTGTPTHM